MGWFFNNDKQEHQTPQNQQNNHNNNTYSYSKRFYQSSSMKCQNDPEDNQMMICEQTVSDGRNTQKRIKRVPKTQNILPFSFPQFDERNNERDQNIDDELQRMEDELEKMFSNFMGGMNLFNRMFDMNDQHINQFNQRAYHQQHQYEKPKKDKKYEQSQNYFFDSNQKDTNIRDL